jgi:hypothetical protein
MRRWMAWLVLGLLAVPGGAEEIGVAIRVNPDVQGYGVGEPIRKISENDPIELGMKIFLRPVPHQKLQPYLKVAFRSGGCQMMHGAKNYQFTSAARFDGLSEVTFGDPLTGKLLLALGRMWLAHHPDAGCDLDVDTPHAGIRIKGTYLRVLVDPVVGTFVAVDEGTVTVQAKAGGKPVEVTAGNWVLVPPGGLPTRPAPQPPGNDDEILQDPPLLGCCTGTEPPKSRSGPP